MPQYIQFNDDGFITATVITDGEEPSMENQLVFDPPIDVSGKMVDINTLQLIDAPPDEGE